MSADDQKKFVQDLETVIYGCHAPTREEVAAVFAEHDLFTFSFAEYFLDEPVVSEDGVENRKLYFPFLERAARDVKFWIKSDPANRRSLTKFLPKTRQFLRNVRLTSLEGEALSATQWEFILPVIKGFVTDKQPNHKGLNKAEDIFGLMMNNASAATNYSYDIQVHLWADGASDDTPIRVMRIPIASETTVYGYIAITYRGAAEDAVISQKKTDTKKLEDQIDECVLKLARERYVPTLVLLHVSKWEGLLRAHLEKGKANPATSPITLDWQKSSNEFESAFGRLWERRDHFLKRRKNDDAAKATVLRSIILDDYHIASPAMVKQVREVIRGAKLMQQPTKRGDPLPSALVFGEAGSGKDKMARLIPTLTEHYFTAPVRTHNMAAIKPTMIAVPMLFGAQLPYGGSLPGVFSAGRADTDWAIRLAPWAGPQQSREQVFVLDELNSLDYDMQGSLLRLLENSEVARLFSTEEPEWINALIVGIVNEDPEEVTRENELRLLRGAEEFLGKAEAARLYDSLHHARRLRPDLVYRLKRGVYVRMPALRDRREDIPLLFKYPCTGHLKTLCKDYFGKKVLVSGSEKDLEVTVEYELEAFDALMRRELPWPGNIRQLQAVARKVADDVWDWWKNNFGKHDGGKVEIEVRRAQVQEVLRKAFPTELGRGNQAEDRPD